MSTFSDEYRSFLLKSLPRANPASGGTEVVGRCYYCPDSANQSHGHLYVSVPIEDDGVSLYNCFKCNASGIVNSKKLIEWGIYDPYFGSNLDKRSKYKGKNNTTYSSFGYRITKNNVYDMVLANQKISYINSRLGINVSMDIYLSINIVPNILDFLRCNGINKYNRHDMIMRQLNDNYVGFLSYDKNQIYLRKINNVLVHKSIDKRWIKYSINDKIQSISQYMIINNYGLDILRNHINIHIAEGPLDILSIYFNLRAMEPSIYVSIGGGDYYNGLVDVLSRFMLYLPDIRIHLYPDNDEVGKEKKIIGIIDQFRIYGFKFFIHRNIYPGEKDLGVPLYKIKEYIKEV